MKLQARSVHQGSAKTFNILAFGRIHGETPSTGRRSKGHSSPEQDARVKRGAEEGLWTIADLFVKRRERALTVEQR